METRSNLMPCGDELETASGAFDVEVGKVTELQQAECLNLSGRALFITEELSLILILCFRYWFKRNLDLQRRQSLAFRSPTNVCTNRTSLALSAHGWKPHLTSAWAYRWLPPLTQRPQPGGENVKHAVLGFKLFCMLVAGLPRGAVWLFKVSDRKEPSFHEQSFAAVTRVCNLLTSFKTSRITVCKLTAQKPAVVPSPRIPEVSHLESRYFRKAGISRDNIDMRARSSGR
ncbi:hypothetical protein RRG08_064721 [Elysia crispata]|uniref:Uncharacterized protein n=1 Tax=Elysia crispata TaxID=231223 RepID=A0AAE1D7Y0_9GAST|nr:hypothetical protein RRG08_064721 [Elysia crispata]